MKKAAAIFAAAALAVFGVAACGSSDDSSDSDTTAADTGATAAPSGATVAIAADPSGAFKFDQDKVDAAAGTTTFEFDNPASLSHDLIVQDESGTEVGKTDLISQDKASFTATLKPGTYTYFCDVPGHEEGGMKGTLTVK